MLPSRLFQRTAARQHLCLRIIDAATTAGARQHLLLRRTLSTSSTGTTTRTAPATPTDAAASTVPEVTLSEITAAAYRIKDEVVSHRFARCALMLLSLTSLVLSLPLVTSLARLTDPPSPLTTPQVHTTCNRSNRLSELFGMELFTKNEYEQVTGSFKERGGANVIAQLDDAQRKAGVIAASAGNHALALAFHGPRSDVPVTVVMPEIAPLTKVNNCRSYGAEVIQAGGHLLEARDAAAEIGIDRGMVYVNGYDDVGIIAGQGTIGLESKSLHGAPSHTDRKHLGTSTHTVAL